MTLMAPGVLCRSFDRMMPKAHFDLPRVVSALGAAALLAWLFAWHPFSPHQVSDPISFEIETISARTGHMAMLLDEGHGFPVDRPPEVLRQLHASGTPQRHTFLLPPGRVRELRIEIDGVPELKLAAARVASASGTVLAPVRLEECKPNPQTTAEGAETILHLRPTVAGGDFGFQVRFAPPIEVPAGDEPWFIEVLAIFLAAFVVVYALQPARLLTRGAEWVGQRVQFRDRPKLTLLAVALGAALLSCYPVVFLGKSFVSPNTVAYLLYLRSPTIPGAPDERPVYGAGSDLGATLWQTLPYSVIESRALAKDHEFPLWNRYNSGGTSLFPQGLSMLGDPLHALPLLAGGAWWAWDIKFILAKVLFAFGTGLCCWSLTRHLSASALLAAAAPWIGFFAYRFNHPAFFSVCYAPWVLLPWLAIRRTEAKRWLCAAGLLLANWIEFSSGTVKEASILLVALNLTGVLLVLNGHERWRKLAPMIWANVLFALLSAPLWLTFLDALRQAVTIYDVPQAYQLQPGLLIAFFDSIFSQDFTRQENITHPAANFVVLLGVLWAVYHRAPEAGPKRALVISAAGAAAFVFGVIPPAWITPLPFLGRIEHIYNTFGCVLLALLLPLAGWGLAGAMMERDPQRWRAVWVKVMLTVAAMFGAYLGFTQALPESALASYRLDPPLRSYFFAWYVPALLLGVAGLPWGLRWLSTATKREAGSLMAAACLFVLLFRGGMYSATKFDDYVMTPRTGMDLSPQSSAVNFARLALTEPARVCGFSGTLAPGYQAVAGLEGIAGPDALHNPYYKELAAAAGINCAWGWRLTVEQDTLADLRPVYDALNLRFYLREIEGGAPRLPGLELAGSADLQVYESHTVWPRAFFTDGSASYRSAADFAAMLKSGDGRPFAAVQGKTTAQGASFAGRQVVPGRDYRLMNNTTEFTVSAPSSGVAVLTESFEEGNFRVTVNGAPAKYFRVNHAFKGVYLPAAGEYRIRYTYWPKLLTPALWLAAGGGLLSLATLALVSRRKVTIKAPAPDLALEPAVLLS